MWLFLLILLFALIIFIPIPIMFKVVYMDNILNVYIYNKLIFSNKKDTNKKNLNDKEAPKKKKKSISKNSSKKFDINALLSSLYNNPYKPRLKLGVYFEYSLDDAAYTALLYGVLNSTFSIPFNILNTFLKLQMQDFKIVPLFNNTTSFFIKIKGIFYINLAKIIYILFLYFSNMRKNN